jgi:hypothetical protein
MNSVFDKAQKIKVFTAKRIFKFCNFLTILTSVRSVFEAEPGQDWPWNFHPGHTTQNNSRQNNFVMKVVGHVV